MFKSLITLIFCFSLIPHAFAEIKVRWLTVASVIIEDGESAILVDPAWTRPTLLNALGLSRLKSDEKLVESELKKLNITKVDGIFTSHQHFDHSLDAPVVARLTGAVNYVDENSLLISNAFKDPRIKTKMISDNGIIEIGKFKITTMKREHAAIRAMGTKFLPGAVPADFDFGFWQYHEGQTWFYLIEHPEKNILLDQASESRPDLIAGKTKKIDVLIQGIANRESDKVFLDGYLKIYNPSVFIPLHFDNFFKQFDGKDPGRLYGVKFEEILGKIKKEFPQTKVIDPVYGEAYSL